MHSDVAEPKVALMHRIITLIEQHMLITFQDEIFQVFGEKVAVCWQHVISCCQYQNDPLGHGQDLLSLTLRFKLGAEIYFLLTPSKWPVLTSYRNSNLAPRSIFFDLELEFENFKINIYISRPWVTVCHFRPRARGGRSSSWKHGWAEIFPSHVYYILWSIFVSLGTLHICV